MDSEKIGPALGRIPSGIYILTAHHEGEDIGMLASFVEQAAFEPPMVTVSVGSGRRMEDALDTGCEFGINIVGEQSAHLIKPFAKSGVTSPFEGLALVDNQWYLPQLEEALAFLVCRVDQPIVAGDHTVYTAEVIDAELQKDDESPMVRIRKNGFQY